jgi:hypothetical protein
MEKEKEKVVRSKKVANVANDDILDCRLCNRCKIAHKEYQESQVQSTNEKKKKANIKKLQKISKTLYDDKIIDEVLLNSISNVQV